MTTPKQPEEVLLLSIHPRYSELILSGHKTIELRKRRPRLPAGALVLMYASAPVCALVGAFVLGGVLERRPLDLWQEYGSQTGVSRDVFERYYADREKAFGLLVDQVRPLEERVSLGALRKCWKRFHPPQSYRYLWNGRSGLGLRFADETAYFTPRPVSQG
ncbi:ASCH domain-containing protein [Pseudenhygromyxa sp. WMMC2535]|uniref:ASCH domain-containing protein n=1 Tax=Pseudenhygromyxa sp. WMMC2535 TaxID=2712867 RepID=UPI0015578AFA|nr:ASCH domain-containing protein [Pseudenhygromyxa sp. WMMC2535]NVB42339.1 ASCH domain-containing protein [Pseudenhygromyxa sp. WMMC2535]